MSRLPPCPERLTRADRYTWDLGDAEGEDRKWRERRFPMLPPLFQMAAARNYRQIYRAQGRRQANRYLLELTESFDPLAVRLALDEDEVKQYAERRARECQKSIIGNDPDLATYARVACIIEDLGFRAPIVDDRISLPGALKRMTDSQWWKAQLRNRYRAEFEETAIRCGLVHAKAAIYVSDESLRAFKSRRARNLELLEAMEAVNEVGQAYSLAELVALSVSNPSNRRHELMARLYGFDVIAQGVNHAGLFVTLTCPSRMHARYKSSGDINPSYDGTTPNQAQQYLCQVWARIRARLKSEGIHVYGFRVAEPQHDGTPHWHILLYTNRENLELIKETCLGYALKDSPDEKGAKERRCLFKEIDWSKGTGIGYIAKYIAKNIDGEHIDKDRNGKDAKDSAIRVAAWASIHKIRQFQQFGGPPVTCWRELRKISEATNGLLEDARKAADEGDWELFTRLFGGTETSRKDQPIKLLHGFFEECGRYGEPKGDQIVGVTDGLLDLVTRVHAWKITRKDRSGSLPGAAREVA